MFRRREVLRRCAIGLIWDPLALNPANSGVSQHNPSIPDIESVGSTSSRFRSLTISRNSLLFEQKSLFQNF
jgi:hypothetical protein